MATKLSGELPPPPPLPLAPLIGLMWLLVLDDEPSRCLSLLLSLCVCGGGREIIYIGHKGHP